MFPFSFEWVWDAGHLIFHGGLWYALNVITLGMIFCVVKAFLETVKGSNDGGCSNH